MTIWECEIGFAGALPAKANKAVAANLLQRAIGRKFKELVGKVADFTFCEVNGELDAISREAAKVGDQPLVVFHFKIGVKDHVELQDGADGPIRYLAGLMFDALFRTDHTFNFSGWGGSLTEAEQQFLKKE